MQKKPYGIVLRTHCKGSTCHTGDPQFPMQMRASDETTTANSAYLLSGFHRLACPNQDACLVPVAAEDATPMVDNGGVAAHLEPANEHNDATRRGANWRADRPVQSRLRCESDR